MTKEVNLAGKDFFTDEEAAFYSCVSPSQFRKRAAEEGITPRTWMGKKVYRKEDIQERMNRLWQR